MPTRSSETLGEAYAQKRFLSKTMWEPTKALLCALQIHRVQFYACRLPSVELQRARPSTERAFNSTVLVLGSPHTPCNQRAASEVKWSLCAESGTASVERRR